ncbi:MAG: hypothetical protein F6K50_11925 [Moorea sp. SIO3I7]|nr:hypothetical protein [Moorena sp. SIO3I7]
MGDFKSFVPPRIGGLGGRNHTQNQQRQKFRSTRFGNWWAVPKTSVPKQINLTAALPTLLLWWAVPKNAMLGTSRYAIANTSISRLHCPAYYFL